MSRRTPEYKQPQTHDPFSSKPIEETEPAVCNDEMTEGQITQEKDSREFLERMTERQERWNALPPGKKWYSDGMSGRNYKAELEALNRPCVTAPAAESVSWLSGISFGDTFNYIVLTLSGLTFGLISPAVMPWVLLGITVITLLRFIRGRFF